MNLEGFDTVNGFTWPSEDRDCRVVVFGETHKLDVVIPLCSGRRVAVQAGGNCGVFPTYLAKHFDHVYTFEPEPKNFVALTVNTSHYPNVIRFQAALGSEKELIALKEERQNCGATAVDRVGCGYIPTLQIDSLGLLACDLIYLDVEGYEMKALCGAHSTLTSFRPVVVVEDKGLSDVYGVAKGAVLRWLEDTMQYAVHSRIQRDVILVPRERKNGQQT